MTIINRDNRNISTLSFFKALLNRVSLFLKFIKEDK